MVAVLAAVRRARLNHGCGPDNDRGPRCSARVHATTREGFTANNNYGGDVSRDLRSRHDWLRLVWAGAEGWRTALPPTGGGVTGGQTWET